MQGTSGPTPDRCLRFVLDSASGHPYLMQHVRGLTSGGAVAFPLQVRPRAGSRPPGGCMNGVFRRIGVPVCLILLVGVAPALAQVSTGEVFGKATDSTGAVLPGCTVTLSGPALIQPMVAVTAESGGYRFPSIPIGTYAVAFELTGFKKVVRTDIIIQAGFNAEINARLELSSVQETVTVTGESPVVDTKSTTLSASFTKDTLEKI